MVIAAHFTDKKMEVRQMVGRASVRTQSWDAKPKGCLLLSQAVFCPSLSSFPREGWGGAEG